MKTILRVFLLSCLLTASLSAQSNWEETKATPTRPWLFGDFQPAPEGFGRHVRAGIFPGFGFSREARASHLLSRFLPSRHHRPASARPQVFSLFSDPYWGSPYSGRYPYWSSYHQFPQFGYSADLYNSQRFVDEWKNRDPQLDAEYSSGDGGLARSTVLAEGMTEEQVLGAVGSPLETVSMGTRSVWKYSGYSLLFEGGSLKEIR
jgi:hypothetical protein